MREHHVAGDVAVRIADRMSVSGAGRGQRLESEALQVTGTADIPRVWDDKAAALVKLAECTAFIGGAHESGLFMRWASRQCLQQRAIIASTSKGGSPSRPEFRGVNTRDGGIFRHRDVIDLTMLLLSAAPVIR